MLGLGCGGCVCGLLFVAQLVGGAQVERDLFFDHNQLRWIDAPKAKFVAVQEAQTLLTTPTSPVFVSKLENGMTVVLKEAKDHPIVTVQMWYRVGSHNEPKRANGVSHLLEHLLFKGTEKRPVQFMRLFNALGADTNAFTNHDVTVFHETMVRDKLLHTLTIEADRMRAPRLTEADLRSERDVVISELLGFEGSSGFRLDRGILAATYGNDTGYGRPIGGYVEEVENLTLAQVTSHHAKHYNPQNLTLVVVGDFSTQKTLGWISQLFSPPSETSKVEFQHAMLLYLLTSNKVFPADPFAAWYFQTYVARLWTQLVSATNNTDASWQPSRSASLENVTVDDMFMRYHVQDHSVQHAQQVSDMIIATMRNASLFIPEGFKELMHSHAISHMLSHADEHTNMVNDVIAEQQNLPQADDIVPKQQGETLSNSLIQLLGMDKLTGNKASAFQTLLQHMAQHHKEPSHSTPGNTATSFLETSQQQLDLRNELVTAIMQHVKQETAKQQVAKVLQPVDLLATESGFIGTILQPPQLPPQEDYLLSSVPPFLVDSTSAETVLVEVLFPFQTLTYDRLQVACLEVFDYVISGGSMGTLVSSLVHHNVSWSQLSTDLQVQLETTWYSITLAVETENEITPVVAAITAVINRLRSVDVDLDDLTRAKNNIILAMLEDSELQSSVATRLGKDFVYAKNPYHSVAYANAVWSLAPHHLREFVNTFFKRGMARIGVSVPPSQKPAEDIRASPQQAPPSARLKSVHHSPQHEAERGIMVLLSPTVTSSTTTTHQDSAESAAGFVSPAEVLSYLPTLPSLLQHVPLRIPHPTNFTLENGLAVTLVPVASATLVRISVVLEAGSVLDPVGKAGLASLTARLMRYGSTNFSYSDFVYNLESDGSKLSISPSREAIKITGVASSTANAGRLLSIIREWIMFPSFDHEIFTAVRASFALSIGADKKDADIRGKQMLQRSVFPGGHPFHSFPSPVSVLSITHDDVVRFHNSTIAPGTTRIAVSGGFDAKEMQAWVSELFGGWNKTATASFGLPVISENRTTTAESEDIDSSADVLTLWGREGVSVCNDSVFWVATVANQILGGDTLSSRLGTHVRDNHGLTYGVHSKLEAGILGGMFVIRMQTSPEKTIEAEREVLIALSDFAAQGVTELETDMAKRNLLSHHTMSLERPSSVAEFLLRTARCSDQRDLHLEAERVYQQILHVTPEQVNEFARSYLKPEQLFKVAVGAVNDIY